jgi:hypothetical protein
MTDSAIGRPLTESLHWWLTALVHEVGARKATDLLGMSRVTLLAALANQPVSARTEQKVHAGRERQILDLSKFETNNP